MTTAERYGPWAVVCGASDGVGAAFAEQLAVAGVNLVLVARRQALLEELADRLPVETRVVCLDLSVPTAITELAAATDDLEVGLLVFNAGADSLNQTFLEWTLPELHAFAQRNCAAVVEASHHFGGPMVGRGRGGVVLVTSGAAWAGGAKLAIYSATKAFDLLLAESLWAEWKDAGVDVLALVLGATDTPSLQRSLAAHGTSAAHLASPTDVAVTTLEHLSDGPTWSFGTPEPTGPPILGGLSRRDAVTLISAGHEAMFSGAAAG